MTEALILSQNARGILAPIARLLGYVINGIYELLYNLFHVQNVAVTIIIFTIVIYLCLLPLTIKQQKFSKFTQIMNPELQAIQKKYKNKRDQESVMRMNEETREVYRKYGVSPSGSCVQMVIQLLILFPLYRVIYNVPGYITRIRNIFTDSVNGIMGTDGFAGIMDNFYNTVKEGNYVMKNIGGVAFDGSSTDAANSIIDVLYRCTSANWETLKHTFSGLQDVLTTAQHGIDQVNTFLGINIVYSPKNIISTSFHEGNYALIALAIVIPLLSLASQFLNIRLMPQMSAAGNSGNQMANQMKIMNYLMPIYSFILVFFLPVGVGIYWITSALVRCVQQLLINRHLNKIDLDAMIKKNQEKAKAKEKKRIEKKGVSGSAISNAARINTRNIDAQPVKRTMAEKASSVNNINKTQNKTQNKTETKETASKNKKSKAGSLASKANLVREYNEKNTRK